MIYSQSLINKDQHIGCRIQLNPNGSDLRCGDKINNLNWNPNEGALQLCPMCRIRMQNMSLIDAINRRVGGDQNTQTAKL